MLNSLIFMTFITDYVLQSYFQVESVSVLKGEKNAFQITTKPGRTYYMVRIQAFVMHYRKILRSDTFVNCIL